MSDVYEQELWGERTCPCGCQENPEQCVYASTCKTCGKKYAGFGYCNTEHDCPECRQSKRSEKLPSWLESLIKNHPEFAPNVIKEAFGNGQEEPYIIPECLFDADPLGDPTGEPIEVAFADGLLYLSGTITAPNTPIQLIFTLEEIVELAVFALCAEVEEGEDEEE